MINLQKERRIFCGPFIFRVAVLSQWSLKSVLLNGNNLIKNVIEFETLKKFNEKKKEW